MWLEIVSKIKLSKINDSNLEDQQIDNIVYCDIIDVSRKAKVFISCNNRWN